MKKSGLGFLPVPRQNDDQLLNQQLVNLSVILLTSEVQYSQSFGEGRLSGSACRAAAIFRNAHTSTCKWTCGHFGKWPPPCTPTRSIVLRQNSENTELHSLIILQTSSQAVDLKVDRHFGEGQEGIQVQIFS